MSHMLQTHPKGLTDFNHSFCQTVTNQIIPIEQLAFLNLGTHSFNCTMVPPTMQVLGATHFGAATEILSFHSVPVPKCTPMDVLVRMVFSDANPVDLQKLSGGPAQGQQVPISPFVPGFGGSGTIIEVGTDSLLADWVGKRVAFLGDPARSGSYAEYVAVDYRCVAEIPDNVGFRQAAAIAVSGCTAFESLMKLGLGPEDSIKSHAKKCKYNLLIVGGSGGVGSWATRLARCWHPELHIIATASRPESSSWCIENGANTVIGHRQITERLGGGPAGSVDYILCLTEPTPPVFKAITEAVRPFGSICLVVAGRSIQSVDLGFCFFKGATIVNETVFASIRTHFQSSTQPGAEISEILDLLSRQKVQAPLSPALDTMDFDWKSALRSNGVLETLSTEHTCGKLVLKIASETSH